MTVRIGVVGTAGIGLAHLFTAQVLPREEITAVCDAVPERAEQAGRDFGGRVFTDAHELFGSDLVDVAVIATPPDSHLPLASAALDAGLHVYLEKPIARTAAEGHAIADAARTAGRQVQVGFQYRFMPAQLRAAELVASGAIGRVFRADLVATSWFRPRRYFAEAGWRAEWTRAGGGVLMAQAIHQLDALIGLAGRPDRVTAQAFRARHDVSVEGEIMAMMEWTPDDGHPDGGRGMLVASLADPVGSDRIEVHGTEASLRIEGSDLWVGRFEGPVDRLLDASEGDVFARVPVTWTRELEGDGGRSEEFESFQACHNELLDAIDGGAPPRNRPELAVRAVEVANAAYQSALDGAPVEVPVAADRYATTLDDLAAGRVAFPARPGGAG